MEYFIPNVQYFWVISVTFFLDVFLNRNNQISLQYAVSFNEVMLKNSEKRNEIFRKLIIFSATEFSAAFSLKIRFLRNSDFGSKTKTYFPPISNLIYEGNFEIGWLTAEIGSYLLRTKNVPYLTDSDHRNFSLFVILFRRKKKRRKSSNRSWRARWIKRALYDYRNVTRCQVTYFFLFCV